MKTWAEVEQSQAYQAMAPEDRDAARGQYFDQVVAPQVPQADRAAARQQFDHATRASIEPGAGHQDWLGRHLQAAPHTIEGKGGAGEAGLGMLTGMVAAPVAGLAGLASMVPGVSDKPAGQVVQDVERALTYQPRTAAGQKAEKTLTYLPEKYSQVMDYAGGKVADWTLKAGASPEVSALLGAGVKTAGEMAPAAFGLRGMRGGTGAAAAGGTAEAGAAEAAATRAAAERAAAAVDRSAGTAAEGGQPGVRWTDLPAHVQEKITEAARHAESFDKLSPEALQRAARLESLDIRYSRGDVTRDPRQMGLEADLARGTAEGRELAELKLEQTRRLHEHLETLQGRGAPQASTPSQAGKAVVENLKSQAEASSKRVDQLYDQARKTGETAATVDSEPLLDLINKAPNPLHLDYIGNKLKRLGMAKQDEAGNWVTTGKPISLNDLEEIYKGASAEGKAGGTEGHYAGLVKQRINEMTEGAGGDAYRAARAARSEHARTFENPKMMDRLLGEEKGNRKTALEDVWNKTVVDGSISDLELVKRQLLTGKDRPRAARQAWREVQGQTVQFIRDMATKGPKDEMGRRAVSGTKMRQALNSIGEEKLNTIFSKETTRRLYKLADAAEDLTTAPRRAAAVGSDTMTRFLSMLDTVTKIPIVGTPFKVAAGAAKTVAELSKKGEAGAQVREALRSPLDPTAKKFSMKEGLEALDKAARPSIARLSQPVPQQFPIQSAPSGGGQ